MGGGISAGVPGHVPPPAHCHVPIPPNILTGADCIPENGEVPWQTPWASQLPEKNRTLLLSPSHTPLLCLLGLLQSLDLQ